MAAAGAPALLTASVGSCVVGNGSGGGGEGGTKTFIPPEPPSALKNIWTPPALRKGAKGWQQSEGAVWQGWKAPSFFPKA